MSIADQVSRIVAPTVIRYHAWRGDPLARWVGPKGRRDPYPLYEGMRRQPMTRSSLGLWLTASHATAGALLRDRRFSSSPAHQKGYRPPSYPPDDPRSGLPDIEMLEMDPPDHTRLRRLVSGAFTPKAVAGLEPWIRETTVRLLDQASAPGGFDVIDGLAFPLPMAVICRLLGVPAADQAQFRAWGAGVAAGLEPRTSRAARPIQAEESEVALTRYLRELVDRRRREPDDSILSALIAAQEEGDQLSEGEVVSTALLLLVAGFETTVNLIGNGTVALLSEPEQWQRLHEEPGLVPAAVEELLRYDSPVQVTARIATEDIDVAGTLMPAGAQVLVAIGGANRDPAVFDSPDQLRIDRPNAGQHLSFSFGIHHCLGNPLARLEARVAFEELTRRFPRLQAAAPPVRRPLRVLRGYERVPVRSPRGAPARFDYAPGHEDHASV